jgi:hypothetical protein
VDVVGVGNVAVVAAPDAMVVRATVVVVAADADKVDESTPGAIVLRDVPPTSMDDVDPQPTSTHATPTSPITQGSFTRGSTLRRQDRFPPC